MATYNGKYYETDLEVARLRAADFPTCTCEKCEVARKMVEENKDKK